MTTLFCDTGKELDSETDDGTSHEHKRTEKRVLRQRDPRGVKLTAKEAHQRDHQAKAALFDYNNEKHYSTKRKLKWNPSTSTGGKAPKSDHSNTACQQQQHDDDDDDDDDESVNDDDDHYDGDYYTINSSNTSHEETIHLTRAIAQRKQAYGGVFNDIGFNRDTQALASVHHDKDSNTTTIVHNPIRHNSDEHHHLQIVNGVFSSVPVFEQHTTNIYDSPPLCFSSSSSSFLSVSTDDSSHFTIPAAAVPTSFSLPLTPPSSPIHKPLPSTSSSSSSTPSRPMPSSCYSSSSSSSPVKPVSQPPSLSLPTPSVVKGIPQEQPSDAVSRSRPIPAILLPSTVLPAIVLDKPPPEKDQQLATLSSSSSTTDIEEQCIQNIFRYIDEMNKLNGSSLT